MLVALWCVGCVVLCVGVCCVGLVNKVLIVLYMVFMGVLWWLLVWLVVLGATFIRE